jgi:hypothetical protein
MPGSRACRTHPLTTATHHSHTTRTRARAQGMYDKLDQLQPLVEGLGRSHRLAVA